MVRQDARNTEEAEAVTPTDWILIGFTLLGFGEVCREAQAAQPFRALVFIIATLCLGIGFLDNAGVF